ncbi:1,6-anhydro-N-acetylmuramyl-L-alanine amidase AmpD [bacterium BMS3Bbin11]|nr:1,6-anhydro-N-acetylmuramyl-L-alanine amidase AmpD [bacterium BMS3Abin11]GBE45490.1 1,6-anhydro-N-acetylmuramyl-L-alanine amidase AmpD [bacterium BMS3Bbin11]HDH08871.1 1,6-anhydro-N-acetylmuramyl-L-alanine amidase AmpD [Gammaproteobacteria bacterium]HDH16157.1 1,6-anhydro-N-acetylmuramyl-L-alanine amidase AmpD [Gammaproteobacteria bacterium]HDZ78051.1 1,6-anhydro-N-acetylmuramyl-L-alanine amidase AmpD [Gammaproteobacteria bacterium]
MAKESQKTYLSRTDYDPETGLVGSARQVFSPNFDARPPGVEIEVLIIHAISLPPGEYEGSYVEQFFCNQLAVDDHPCFTEIAELNVSSHFFILRSGELVQLVPVHQRAWHAGVSSCLGRDAVNDFSIGIELEGCDDDAFEEAQYIALTELSRLLVDVIPLLTDENIYGHSDIAPERKTDPGPCFDWKHYQDKLSKV